MTMFGHRARIALLLSALGLGHSASTAQVVVAFGADTAAVPSLSEWGVVLTAALVAIAAVVMVRRQAGSKALLSLTVAAIAAHAALFGPGVIGRAWANGFTTYSMSSAPGGVLTIPSIQPFAYVLNDTATPQRLRSITPQYLPTQAIDDKPACVPGMVLAPSTACALRTQADN